MHWMVVSCSTQQEACYRKTGPHVVLLTSVYKRTMLHSQGLTLLFYSLVRSTNTLYSVACDQRNILKYFKAGRGIEGCTGTSENVRRRKHRDDGKSRSTQRAVEAGSSPLARLECRKKEVGSRDRKGYC